MCISESVIIEGPHSWLKLCRSSRLLLLLKELYFCIGEDSVRDLFPLRCVKSARTGRKSACVQRSFDRHGSTHRNYAFYANTSKMTNTEMTKQQRGFQIFLFVAGTGPFLLHPLLRVHRAPFLDHSRSRLVSYLFMTSSRLLFVVSCRHSD